MRVLPNLSRFELMWMMVFFDLPVTEKQERKDAADFRNFLLDCGFSMVQYSIYTKLFSGRDAMVKYYKKIQQNVPPHGKVGILAVTDRQYGDIVCYNGGTKSAEKNERNQAAQLLLF